MTKSPRRQLCWTTACLMTLCAMGYGCDSAKPSNAGAQPGKAVDSDITLGVTFAEVAAKVEKAVPSKLMTHPGQISNAFDLTLKNGAAASAAFDEQNRLWLLSSKSSLFDAAGVHVGDRFESVAARPGAHRVIMLPGYGVLVEIEEDNWAGFAWREGEEQELKGRTVDWLEIRSDL